MVGDLCGLFHAISLIIYNSPIGSLVILIVIPEYSLSGRSCVFVCIIALISIHYPCIERAQANRNLLTSKLLNMAIVFPPKTYDSIYAYMDKYVLQCYLIILSSLRLFYRKNNGFFISIFRCVMFLSELTYITVIDRECIIQSRVKLCMRTCFLKFNITNYKIS